MAGLAELANLHAGMEHEPFTPPNNPIGSALQEWARGVKQRTLHPLETLAKAATDVKNMSPVDMAMQFGGPSGGALSGMMGMFAGKGAKTADVVKLAIAEKMKAAGIADDVIHAKTGWFSGMPDGKWRFEIPDDAAKLTKAYRLERASNFTGVDVGKAVDHKPLFDAYPEVADYNASFSDKTFQGGRFSEPDSFGFGKIEVGYGSPQPKSTTLHELQHAIQQREGFARGGSPEAMKSVFVASDPKIVAAASQIRDMAQKYGISVDDIIAKPPKYLREDVTQDAVRYLAKNDEAFANATTRSLDPHEQYRRLAGEAEARLTQARMNMTAKQRAASYPPSMFDVPVEQQIVRYGDGAAMSMPDKLVAQKGLFQGTIDKTRNIDVNGNDLFSQHASMPARAAVEHDINMTVSPLENGKYVLQYRPLGGSSSKEFHIIGDDPNALALAGIDRLTRSDKAISSAQKAKFNNSLLGKLSAEFGDAFSKAKSTQSKSEYLIHNPTGIKIRISDHNLPLGYEQPDVDLRFSQSLEEKLSAIREAIK